ncbi:MAG: hypothetical protein FWB96_07630 [Defluviitaleaceae bacterium]|nr:hypothetical protein [Defluviitaleaceae bacterium]MCL2262795.1 hypothetical protein [Defluviitaleaceae bacterium]
MRNKKIISILLTLVLSLAFTVSLSATEMIGFPNCIESQRERLRELLKGEVIVPFSSGGETVNIPRVNFIVPPEGDRCYFIIGVEETPTPECIEFILHYTGIPYELAYIAKATLTRRVLWVYYDENDHGEDAIPHYVYPTNHQGITPFSTLGMGTMVNIRFPEGRAYMTRGHPLNSNLRGFATAPHTRDAARRNVYVGNRQIGSIGANSAFFDARRDVARVDLHSPNTVHPIIDGGVINSFRETTVVGNTVISVRGQSGIQHSAVRTTNAEGRFTGETFTFFDKIGTYPLGRIQDGDSGAALIRRLAPADRAVLGTLAGDALVGGRLMAIYTKVTNY